VVILIVVFDVEGVLVDGEFLPEAAKLVGKEKEVQEITLAGIAGEINWEEGLRRRIEIIRGISFDDCVEVSQTLPLMKGAKEMADDLRSKDCILVGISGGFSLLAKRVKEALRLDHVFSNDLVFHEGKLIGYALLVSANKRVILDSAFGELLHEDMVVAVVDGANDMDLFDLADLGIAFNAQKIVKEMADIVVDQKDLTLVAKAIKNRAPGR
jgi:phosphoserine phosphatase